MSCIKFLQNLFIEGYEWQAVGGHFISCFTLVFIGPCIIVITEE